MVRESEKKVCLEFRFLPLNGKMSGSAIEINRLMSEMGLMRKIHYSVEPIEISDESLRNLLDYHGGILLQINSLHPLFISPGVIGGYDMITDFLRKHKREIKETVGYLNREMKCLYLDR